MQSFASVWDMLTTVRVSSGEFAERWDARNGFYRPTESHIINGIGLNLCIGGRLWLTGFCRGLGGFKPCERFFLTQFVRVVF